MQLATDTSDSDNEHEWHEYYVTVRFTVRAANAWVARDQVKTWLLGIHKAISKYKSLYLPPGVNKVFELASEAQLVGEE